MKFIHLADVHLGAGAGKDEAAEAARQRQAWDTFVGTVEDAGREDVDLLLIAGDLFDAPPSMPDLQEINKVFARIPNVRVVMIAGDSDYVSRGSAWMDMRWNKNVAVMLSRSCECVRLPEINTDVYGMSYYSERLPENICSGLRPIDKHKTNILLVHGGDADHIPMDALELAKSGFDYIAMGHVHKPSAFIPRMAIYSGSLEPLDERETGKHGYILGEAKGHKLKLEFVPKAKIRHMKKKQAPRQDEDGAAYEEDAAAQEARQRAARQAAEDETDAGYYEADPYDEDRRAAENAGAAANGGQDRGGEASEDGGQQTNSVLRIVSLEPAGFGKFAGQNMKMRAGINVIYGGNETGKSTLHAYIKAMLYGINARGGRKGKDEYSLREPWEKDEPDMSAGAESEQQAGGQTGDGQTGAGQDAGPNAGQTGNAQTAGAAGQNGDGQNGNGKKSGQQSDAYGGAMTVELDGTQYRIERSFRKNHKSVTMTRVSDHRPVNLDGHEPGELLTGLTESEFAATLWMPQGAENGFEVLTEMTGSYLDGAKPSDEPTPEDTLRELMKERASAQEKVRMAEFSVRTAEAARLQQRRKRRKGSIADKVVMIWAILCFLIGIVGALNVVLSPGMGARILFMLMTVCFTAAGMWLFRMWRQNSGGADKILVSEENEDADELRANRAGQGYVDAFKAQVGEIESRIRTVREGDEYRAYEEKKAFNNELSDILTAFTQGRYDGAVTDSEGAIRIVYGNTLVYPHMLGAGTNAQINLAFRMTAADQLTGRMLPLILDEPFVFYDNEALADAIGYLERSGRQVILFTGQTREKQLLDKIRKSE